MEQTIGIKVKIKNPIKLGSKNAYAVKRFLTFLLIIIVAENQPPPYQKFKNPLNLDLNGLEDFSSILFTQKFLNTFCHIFKTLID